MRNKDDKFPSIWGGGLVGDVYENSLSILSTIKFCVILTDSGNCKAAIHLTNFLLVLGLHWSSSILKKF